MGQMAKLMWMVSLFLMRFRRVGFCASLIAFVSACASGTSVTNSDGFRATSSQQLYEFMLSQSVANKRARDIASACSGLSLNRVAIAQRNTVLNNELDRLEKDDPEVLLEFADRMGLPADRNADTTSQTGSSRPTVLAMTELNSRMLADFGGSLLLRLAVAQPSQSCADGAREIDGATLTGSFLKPVNAWDD